MSGAAVRVLGRQGRQRGLQVKKSTTWQAATSRLEVMTARSQRGDELDQLGSVGFDFQLGVSRKAFFEPFDGFNYRFRMPLALFVMFGVAKIAFVLRSGREGQAQIDFSFQECEQNP